MYEFLKAIHIVCIILFMGTVFFRTFVILKIISVFPKEEGNKIQQAMGSKARGIIKINNLILIISGLLLFFLYANTSSIILHIKVLLGLVLVIGFYCISCKCNSNFSSFWNYGLA